MGSLAFVSTIGGVIEGSTIAVFIQLALLNFITYERTVETLDQPLILLVVLVNIATLITLDWFRNGSAEYETT